MDLDRWSEAKEAMDKALFLGEYSAIAFVESAIVEAKLGNWSASLDRLNNAIRLDSTLAVAYLHQSRALVALGRLTEANTQLKLAESHGAPTIQIRAVTELIQSLEVQ